MMRLLLFCAKISSFQQKVMDLKKASPSYRGTNDYSNIDIKLFVWSFCHEVERKLCH